MEECLTVTPLQAVGERRRSQVLEILLHPLTFLFKLWHIQCERFQYKNVFLFVQIVMDDLVFIIVSLLALLV